MLRCQELCHGCDPTRRVRRVQERHGRPADERTRHGPGWRRWWPSLRAVGGRSPQQASRRQCVRLRRMRRTAPPASLEYLEGRPPEADGGAGSRAAGAAEAGLEQLVAPAVRLRRTRPGSARSARSPPEAGAWGPPARRSARPTRPERSARAARPAAPAAERLAPTLRRTRRPRRPPPGPRPGAGRASECWGNPRPGSERA